MVRIWQGLTTYSK